MGVFGRPLLYQPHRGILQLSVLLVNSNFFFLKLPIPVFCHWIFLVATHSQSWQKEANKKPDLIKCISNFFLKIFYFVYIIPPTCPRKNLRTLRILKNMIRMTCELQEQQPPLFLSFNMNYLATLEPNGSEHKLLDQTAGGNVCPQLHHLLAVFIDMFLISL